MTWWEALLAAVGGMTALIIVLGVCASRARSHCPGCRNAAELGAGWFCSDHGFGPGGTGPS